MEKVNELSFERLQLVHEYVLLAKQLDSYLSNARISFSKAKTIHGVTMTSLADPDSLDLVASARVEAGESYSLIESESKSEATNKRKSTKEEPSEEEKKEISEKERKKKAEEAQGSFRPFGVLEPSVAKEGRKMMGSALKIICDMATAQHQIRRIDEDMKRFATVSHHDNLEKLIECLKL